MSNSTLGANKPAFRTYVVLLAPESIQAQRVCPERPAASAGGSESIEERLEAQPAGIATHELLTA